jgi:hypothetical protein
MTAAKRCELCGERFSERDERAEMFDPTREQPSLIVHAQCGIAAGMEVA